MSRFERFCAIDWSGAAGERQKAIAVAVAHRAGGPPALLRPAGQGWSRPEVLALLAGMDDATLAGLDLGLALPHADAGAYFPGWDESPPDARALWALVDAWCAEEPHLGASALADHPLLAPHFRRHGGREGALFHLPGAAHRRGRFRVTELAQESRLGLRPYSNFNLVGAAQVGKSSLTGMRVLHRLRGRIGIWPVDPLPAPGRPLIVEIYTTIAALAAGRSAARSKIRSFADLNDALDALDCPPVAGSGPLDDHSADALLSAAWLRLAAARPELWTPAGLTPALAATEGWTFGVP